MIPKSECPYCKAVLFDNNPPFQPKPGSFSICMYCGEVNSFNKKLHLIKPTKAHKVPKNIRANSLIVKLALSAGVNVEQAVKDILIKEGRIKSH